MSNKGNEPWWILLGRSLDVTGKILDAIRKSFVYHKEELWMPKERAALDVTKKSSGCYSEEFYMP